MMLMEVKDVTKLYKRRDTFPAVDHVNLLVKKGSYITITGSSGSGKSTLFHMMAGLLKPSEGEILLDGIKLTNKKQKELDYLRNQKIGYLMQGQNLLGNFNVIDNLCMPAYLSGKKGVEKYKVLEALEMVGLKEAADAYPFQLSGGEQRRVAIVRVFLHNPLLLIADEPTSNLDMENSEKVMELLRRIHTMGTTVILSTHDRAYLNYGITYMMEKGNLFFKN